jgi:hypothetical protein
MTRRLLSFLATTFFLILIGAVIGTILAVLGLALDSALQSLQASSGDGLLDFLVDLFFLLINVLAVSTVAAPDGAWVGIITAAAISVVYGLTLWFVPHLQRAWLALLLAITGAVAATLSLRGMLADYGLVAAIAGALFGLFVALALSKRQPATSPDSKAALASQPK